MTSFIRQGVSARCLSIAGRAAAVAATLCLAACSQVTEGGLAGLVGGKAPETAVAGRTTPESELERATAYWGKEAAKNPQDGKAALNYARNLKALGRKQEALSVLQASYMFSAENKDYLSEYGRLALELGQVNTAAQLLEQADDPIKPDWRILSARGTVMAKQGNYKEAVPFYERALQLAPGQASILNNLALAYTMDGQAEKAEQYLRQAASSGASDPRIRQNLAMVLSLQGKTAEARTVAEAEDGTAIRSASNSQAASEPAPAATRTPPQEASPVASVSLTPDEIIEAAMKAEEAKRKAAERPIRKRALTVAAQDEPAPALRQAAR